MDRQEEQEWCIKSSDFGICNGHTRDEVIHICDAPVRTMCSRYVLAVDVNADQVREIKNILFSIIILLSGFGRCHAICNVEWTMGSFVRR